MTTPTSQTTAPPWPTKETLATPHGLRDLAARYRERAADMIKKAEEIEAKANKMERASGKH